ncbi:hypothetical protein [Flavobacterium sp.]|uniref:hypothetical protein n=1 Tax=Flavobacterium sp. TaxID=239 RepID=UPI00286BC156|nr:hypothetical protein [Flavobacterium sp.]
MLYTEIKRKIREVKELTNLGLINPTWIRNIEVFEQFHYYRDIDNTKQDAYVLTGEDFGISWQSVRKAVTDLSK